MTPDLAAALDALGRAVSDTPLNALPELVGALEGVKARALARLVSPPGYGVPDRVTVPRQDVPERLLSPDEAAELARVPRRWLLRRTKGLRFRRDLSRKVIRFEAEGLRRWLAASGKGGRFH